MILADKIIRLRKKNGWSQEELADKMKVSRQAVSKWEGAQTIPDLEKVLLLSSLFGVTTDYLLKDEIEDEEFTDENNMSVKRITLAQANDFLEWRRSASLQNAAGTFLCVIAAIPLLILMAAAEVPAYHISEDAAVGIGTTVLLIIIAAAVAIFIFCRLKNAPFDFIDDETFETEYGVSGMVREKQKAYKNIYAKCHIIGTCICVLSPVPLLIGAFINEDFFMIIMLTITMLLVGLGVALFIISNGRWESMQKLLKEGEFAPQEQRKNRIRKKIASVYWLSVTAIYLGWSFWTFAWHNTWIIWPVASVVYAIVMCLCNLIIERER